MKMSDLLQYLRPNAGYVTRGDAYVDIEWLDDAQTKPTEAEVEAARPEVERLLKQQAVNSKALAYLTSTDWYASRKSDDGTPIPEEIAELRAAARREIK